VRKVLLLPTCSRGLIACSLMTKSLKWIWKSLAKAGLLRHHYVKLTLYIVNVAKFGRNIRIFVLNF
jgi:enamine deaminase RidA (YjgF/YER057c/UK114 family)